MYIREIKGIGVGSPEKFMLNKVKLLEHVHAEWQTHHTSEITADPVIA